MPIFDFVKTIELMACSFHGIPDPRYRFVTDAKIIVKEVIRKLDCNHSPFANHMKPMENTVSSVRQIDIDMPLAFETFLPICLPFALSSSFNKDERSVQLKKAGFEHPFFFGNVVNAKTMNFLLQSDLELAVKEISTVEGKWGSVYELKYSALSCNNIPFAHQIVAEERGNNGMMIHFDFILALEFDGAVMPLPAYYKVPLTYKWMAFGLVSVGDHYDGSNWAVLLPRWQSDTVSIRLRCHGMLQLLYRMLYTQRCYCFAVPLLVKFSFFMTTSDWGDGYKTMSVAELLITTLGNFCELIVAYKVGDAVSNRRSSKSLREQQVCCKGIFAMLTKSFQLNAIRVRFIEKLFQFDLSALTETNVAGNMQLCQAGVNEQELDLELELEEDKQREEQTSVCRERQITI
ncbi:uncharacterized protein LOC117571481 [Drosophila albomicans]|uniref:Uncharacterized protein LOC117571481 n=1 Tax=Drosophila albomicans TaxID=7291 RepID=A0A6P8XDH7_DROAB|nr:uncharacterized protein LOC117571481 [Drosophila albomicans]